MTLILNKAKTTTRFITTLSEENVITTGSTIDFFNLSTNVTTIFTLPSDTSLYPSRYNEFLFATSALTTTLTEGTYRYTIKDSASATTETGLMKVIGDSYSLQQEVDNQFIYIPAISTDEEFVVYGQ